MAAARRFLERRSPAALDGVTVDAALEHGSQVDRALESIEPSSVALTRIRSLVVTAVDDDKAEIAADAVVEVPTPRRKGIEMARIDLSGPMQLRRRDGVWKVSDYCIEGRRISESFSSLSGGEASVDGLGVRLAAVDLEPRSTRGFLEVENNGSASARIKRIFLATRGRHSNGALWRARSDVAPGEKATMLLSWWKEVPIGSPRLNVIAEIRTARGRTFVAWDLDLQARTAVASVHHRRPAQLWWPILFGRRLEVRL